MATENTNVYTLPMIEARMAELGDQFAKGQESRETAMLEMARAVEANAFPVSAKRGDKTNGTFNTLFATFRDQTRGKEETNDLSLRSKFLKVCIAADICKANEVPFSARLQRVQVQADALKSAVAAFKKLPAAEQEKAAAPTEPKQLLEAYYSAAQLQVDTVKTADDLTDEQMLEAAAKPPKKVDTRADDIKVREYIAGLVEDITRLIGDASAKPVKKAKYSVSPDIERTLKSIRDDLHELTAEPKPAIDPEVQAKLDRLAALEKAEAERIAAEAERKAKADARKQKATVGK